MTAVSTKHEKAVKWATQEIGQHEVPMGSNTGPFVQSCQAATSLQGTRWPWCVAAWIKAWTVAGYLLPYKGAGAYSFLDWYKQHLPSWVVAQEKAKPGAAVIFNIGSGHLAMLVKQIKPGDKTVTTIGGNESDMMKETVRDRSLIRGIVDPVEAGKVPVAVKPPKRFEVVTSESGKRKVIYASGPTAISKKIGKILNKYGGVTIRPKKP